ncbi:hypothetical protein O6H91_13G094700 [Diphasiastrum complanatum]|uniref:Uncharacterized protein n=1 Tax=Diphasiastrum complanatum TaxID=34168 RepID=A0ACC2BXE6_DIPCM|nr:hypothetical protein O6H91_13G094700 [Diphasiastrum complanatum]
MASWSFEEVAAPSACWPSVNEIDDTIWEDMKGTEDQAVPEPGIVSSNAWISNSDQWRKLFTEVNDDDIGAGQCSFKKGSPDSIAEFSIEKNISALDVSTAELSLEDILSPALDIEGWDSLTLENAPDSLTTDEILASFGCNEENMNAANDIGGNLSLHETEMMLARDLDIFVKDSIDCEEIERDVDRSCPSAMSGGTSTGEFKFFESDTVTEKEGNFVKFAWENIGSLENMDNCIPQVESSNEENKELLSVSAKSSEEISLISDVLSSTCTLESKDRLDQTCLNSHAGNMTDVFYEDSCQPALESSVDLEGQERDISEILTELERHDMKGVKDNEPFLEKEIYAHPRKDHETSRRIQDIEGAGRTIFEIAKESRISSQSCSITDNAYQSQSYSDKKRIDNKFKRHLSCRKESYSSSHRNSRAAYPERQTTVPSVHEIMPMQSPPLQSSASTSTHSFPSTELPSVPCSLSGSSSTISSVQQSQSILSGHQQIGTNLQSQQSEQQDKIASDSFGLPLLDSTSISTQINMQGLLQGRQRCTKSAREKLEEELVRQNVLVGHFQTHSEYKQDVHTQANPEKKTHTLSGSGDLTSMPTQPVCAALPVKLNMISDVLSEKKELSIEAAVFYQLEDTIMKLDIGTRLLIRDALYRLARNAAERRAIGDDRSSSSSPLDLENSILYGSNSSLGSDHQPVPLPQRSMKRSCTNQR